MTIHIEMMQVGFHGRDTEEMIEYMFNIVPTSAVPMIKLFDYLTP